MRLALAIVADGYTLLAFNVFRDTLPGHALFG